MISRADPRKGDRRHRSGPHLGRMDRAAARSMALPVLVLLGEPGVEALHQILAMVAPEFDVADQIGLHVIRRRRQFRQDVLGDEGRRIRTHRTIGDDSGRAARSPRVRPHRPDICRRGRGSWRPSEWRSCHIRRSDRSRRSRRAACPDRSRFECVRSRRSSSPLPWRRGVAAAARPRPTRRCPS